MKKNLFCFLLICMMASPLLAQQDAQLSQYMFNQLTFNPAYSGVEGFTKVSFIHRTQWLGQESTFDGSGANPKTQFLTMDAPLLKFRSGVGLYIIQDQSGPLTNVEAQGSFAYHLAVNEKSKLSFGMRFGVFAQSINGNLYRPIDPDDPVLLKGEESQIRPDLAVGVHYQSEKFYMGLSATHLLKAEFDFGVAELRNALQEHLYFTAGYNYEVNYNFVVTPTVLIKSDLNEYSFDIGAIGTYDQKIWGGVQFRQGESAVILLGYKFLKDQALSLGYAFDYTIKGRDAKAATSHEVMINYRLPPVTVSRKKPVKSPRFRHTNIGTGGAGN